MPSNKTLDLAGWGAVAAAVASLTLGAAPAVAQTVAPAAPAEPAAPAAEAAAPSDSAMVNLVRALVAQGVLKPEVAGQLIAQAEAEAAKARAGALADRGLPPAPAGAVRVPYIPATVREQIKAELRAEVMQEARSGGWAAPGDAAPDWTRRIAIHGDLRVRSQSEIFARTNANSLIDFATLNSFGPYGIDDPRLLLPILDSRTSRWNRARVRARLGLDAQITSWASAGIAIATGENSSPISTFEGLGGGFGKRNVWLDQAWIKLQPLPGISAIFGRFENPFAASDLLYDSDLRLDGAAVALESGKLLGDDVTVSARAGLFPFSYGGSAITTFAFDKPKAPNRYLLAGEIKLAAQSDDFSVSAAVGYHDFHGFQGQLSTPCQVETETFCSTDYLQPLFLAKGNTLSPLRQIVTVDPNANLPQLLGYTFGYRVLSADLVASLALDDDTQVRVSGSYVRNLAFRRGDICRNGLAGRPYNNNGAGTGTFCDTANPATFVGGGTGYRGEALVGTPEPRKRGEWHAFGGYRYLQSDAVLDALTDSDFHLGGTNSKGYFIGAKYAVADGLTVGSRWLSANEISGPPLAIDVLQVDLEARF